MNILLRIYSSKKIVKAYLKAVHALAEDILQYARHDVFFSFFLLFSAQIIAHLFPLFPPIKGFLHLFFLHPPPAHSSLASATLLFSHFLRTSLAHLENSPDSTLDLSCALPAWPHPDATTTAQPCTVAHAFFDEARNRQRAEWL